MKKILLLISFSFMLQGCFFAAGAAAGAAAVAVAYDHRTIEKSALDQKIAHTVFVKMQEVPSLRDESHIEVVCLNHVVLLTGETPRAHLRTQAGEIAQSVAGVDKVYNQVMIQPPTSSLIRTSDSWITTKIKAQMLATKDLKSGSIKIITENSTVYLLGMVTHEQGDIAADIARQTSGVQKVMKIFQYTD